MRSKLRSCPGDVIVGDGEGVVVIPAHLADEIADETVEMTARANCCRPRRVCRHTATGARAHDPRILALLAPAIARKQRRAKVLTAEEESKAFDEAVRL